MCFLDYDFLSIFSLKTQFRTSEFLYLIIFSTMIYNYYMIAIILKWLLYLVSLSSLKNYGSQCRM